MSTIDPTEINVEMSRFITGEPGFYFKWLCDKCGGNMRSTGERFLTTVPSYFHICEGCDYTVALRGGIEFPYTLKQKNPS